MSDVDETQLDAERTARLIHVQDRLAELALVDLHARFIDQPVTTRVAFGLTAAGEQLPAEVTVPGNPTASFHGLVVLNPTLKTVFVGFSPNAGRGALLQVPPMSGLRWAAQYSDLSLAVSEADAQRPVGEVLVMRTPFPILEPEVFPLNAAGAIANSFASAGQVIAPAALGVITEVGKPPAGIYTAQAVTFEGGTVDKKPFNMVLRALGAGSSLEAMFLPSVAAPASTGPVRFFTNGVPQIQIVANEAGEALSLYAASLIVNRVA